jgi:flagellin-like hook-associated protein FlgL
MDSYGRAYFVGGWDGSNLWTDINMWVFADIENPYQIKITSPDDGSTVSGVVVVTAEIVNWMGSSPWSAFMGVDFIVDGAVVETQASGWGGVFSWDTISLVDGSSHVLTVRGYHWDGKVVEDSVTVTVSAASTTDRLTALEDQLEAVQAQMGVLQAQLAAADGNVTMILMTLAALGATFADLQTQIDALEEQVDRIEGKADDAGMYSIINLVLVIIVLVMLILMF